ncbi:MAG: DNA translocase FtsK [Candidatus Doudnabacteria bacterium]|nr:DNA translocase FtsK [Candidatus Doudnabacteria bacterium]
MAKKRNQEQVNFSNYKRPQLNLKKDTRKGLAVVLFVVLAVIFTLSLANLAGPFGSIANQVLKLAFGWVAYVVPLIFLCVAIALFRQDPDEESNTVSTHAYVGAVLLTLTLTGLLHLLVIHNDITVAFQLVKDGRGGGYLGVLTSYPLMQFMGFVASLVILLAGIVVSLLVTFNVSIASFFRRNPEDAKVVKPAPNGKLKINNAANAGFTKESLNEPNKAAKEKPEIMVNNLDDLKLSKAKMTSTVDKNWKFPSLDLLDDSKTKVDSGNIEANVAVIQKTLNDFGIDVEMGEVNVGPTVTQYTFRPAVGVKLSQIASLQNDLALALAASSIRMELPIPGKALVGIEIPNNSKATVRIREIVGSSTFIEQPSKLSFALGRDVAGHPMIADLARMPHLLIAGATGSGKSVAVNSLLISMLFRATPQEVKFIVIDPKRVELNLYNGLPHLLTGVITDHQKAVNALKWTVAEMDRRYKLLSEVHKRNIGEYNAASPNKLPYIVVVIDELADLMAVAQNDVEATIVRLAQMARAVGIHLVVATQRPSVDVITGLIKANITARIAFAVASQVDSRTILDSSGAEKLLGQGDMLYVTAELAKPKRIQGTFVGEKEIKRVIDFIKEQTGSVIYDEQVTEKPQRGVNVPGFENIGNSDEDELLQEAIETVQAAGKASASLLQRRLRVGYARAARLLDILEDKGIIGPGDGAKPREVYGAQPKEEGYGQASEADEFEKSQKGEYD